MILPNQQTIESLVEIITREVLNAYVEKNVPLSLPEGQYCKMECAGGMCVKTCFDRVGRVVSAGAERLSSSPGAIPADLNLAGFIDHTLLKPDVTPEKIVQLCIEARKYNFASVCVNPTHIKLCAELLAGSSVKVCSVIGFPLGATLSEVKVAETKAVIRDGAREVDMVINIGALKAANSTLVAEDIRSVVQAAHEFGVPVKVIIETALLTDEEKVLACLLAKEAGADYVKTSTGFSGGGATVHDITLMRRSVGSEMGVKASGGIQSREDAESMVKAGATRIGASAGIKIVRGTPIPKTESMDAAKKSY